MILQGKQIIFALPGRSYSGEFLCSFTDLVLTCISRGMTVRISQSYSSMVNYARCKVAGADVSRGPKQQPFGGQIPYDYMMWIDSDIRFDQSQVFKLLAHDLDIISGWYCQPGGLSCAVKTMNNDFYIKNSCYQFMTPEGISSYTEPFEVDYNGFGWMLIKKGVFESLPYPWFAPELVEISADGKTLRDVCSEDVAFCTAARKAGFKIYVDPSVRVGHEKTVVL